MNNIFIKQIIAKGKNKRDSMIEFSPKLSIIYGASNTGKTYIFKIINYIFGSKNLDIKANTGYTHFEMIISYDENSIVFSRNLNSDKIIVDSDLPSVKSGTYFIDLDSESPINNVFLKLLGINEPFKVPYNKNCEMKRFTLRSFIHMLMIYEKDTERDLSIILPKETTNRTYFLSHLLYLLYEQDFSNYDPDEKDTIKRAKKTAVKDYINAKITEIQSRVDEIKNNPCILSDSINPTETIDNLSNELSIIQNKIEQSITNGKQILNSINEMNESITDCDIILNRYNSLESQYLSDIKRLSFIVESTSIVQNSQENSICPFCNNHFHEEIPKTNIDSISSEIIRIKNQLNDLKDSKNDVLFEKEQTLAKITELKEEYKQLSHEVNDSLKKQEQDLKYKLNTFQQYIRLTSELNSMRLMTDTWNNDLTNLDKKIEHKTVYKPHELFPSSFEQDITAIIRDILKSCNLPKYETAHFSLKSFDIEINGNTKSANGKGLTAFYNTILVLAFRKYLYDKAIIKPFFYVIDTPLLGLDVGKDEYKEANIRKGIYRYFVNSMNQSQLIIIENEKDLPNINYDVNGIKFHYYSHNKDNETRYGFLLDFED